MSLSYSPPSTPRESPLTMLGMSHAHSPFLALAAYTYQPHAHRQPAHFHLSHEEGPVPPSILRRRSSQDSTSPASSVSAGEDEHASWSPVPAFGRRTSNTPSLYRSSSSSLVSMRSPSSPFTPALSSVEEGEALVASDSVDDEDMFSTLDPMTLGDAKNRLLFAPSPAKATPAPARPAIAKTQSLRPALVRQDTPIPARSSVPADGRRLPRPSQEFTSTLRSEPDMSKYTFPSKAAVPAHAPVRPRLQRKDTPRPHSSLELAALDQHRVRDDAAPSTDAWLATLSSELGRAMSEARAPPSDEDAPVYQSVFESDSESEAGDDVDGDGDEDDAHDQLDRWRHGVARAETGRPQSWTSVQTGRVWVTV